MQEEIKEVEKKQEIAAKDLEDAGKELDQTKEEYRKVEEKLEEYNRKIDQHKDQLTTDKMLLTQSESDIKVLQEQIHAVRQTKSHAHDLVDSLNQRLETCKKRKRRVSCTKRRVRTKASPHYRAVSRQWKKKQ